MLHSQSGDWEREGFNRCLLESVGSAQESRLLRLSFSAGNDKGPSMSTLAKSLVSQACVPREEGVSFISSCFRW